MKRKCPICGNSSEKTFTKNIEPKSSQLINKGLPRLFVMNGWTYYACDDCMHKNSKNFCFAFVYGKIYIFNGDESQWILYEKIEREVVQFT